MNIHRERHSRNPGSTVAETQDEYETFGDDERLAREHEEYFSIDYADVWVHRRFHVAIGIAGLIASLAGLGASEDARR